MLKDVEGYSCFQQEHAVHRSGFNKHERFYLEEGYIEVIVNTGVLKHKFRKN